MSTVCSLGPSTLRLNPSNNLLFEFNAFSLEYGANGITDIFRIWCPNARLVEGGEPVKKQLCGYSTSDSHGLGHSGVAIGIAEKLQGRSDGVLCSGSTRSRGGGYMLWKSTYRRAVLPFHHKLVLQHHQVSLARLEATKAGELSGESIE